MKSIKNAVTNTIEIKRSRFIAWLFPVTHIDAIDAHREDLKKQYPDASHHCVAYLLGDQQDIQRFDDDGEPSQTAGMPMLEVLKKHQLTYVLCVVIRYFGGIKLGGGGLIRAYAKSTSEVLKLATFTVRKTRVIMRVQAAFDVGGKLEGFIRENVKLIEVAYQNDMVFHVDLDENEVAWFETTIRDMSSAQAKTTRIKQYESYR